MKKEWRGEYDFIVVGSGASGATAALAFSEAGYSTLVIEEGSWIRTDDFEPDVYSAMKNLFRDFGAQVTKGGAVLPVLEGRCVGGSTVMNGAIIHRLPEEIHGEWVQSEKRFQNELPFADLDKHSEKIERDLSVRRNLDPLLPVLPISQHLTEKGWSHHAMARNAPGCEGSGRCLQGCPTGGKWSMEKTYLPRAVRAGAVVRANTRVRQIIVERGVAVGVDTDRGRFRAVLAVVVAAGAIQTPLLLERTGFKRSHSHLGKHFQTHLGIGIVARMARTQFELEGPPQGIEVSAFQGDRIKLATQLMPPELLLSRTPLMGDELLAELRCAQYYCSWTASIRSEAEGSVTSGFMGLPKLRFSPTEKDLARVRRSLMILSEMLFAMGAERVFPGVMGPQSVPVELKSSSDIKRIEEIPLDARYYLLSLGHLFGTCRMGGETNRSVVGFGFELHGVRRLHVVDASVFPSNLGVNPQHSVMSLSAFGSSRILDLYGGRKTGLKSSSAAKFSAGREERPMSINS